MNSWLAVENICRVQTKQPRCQDHLLSTWQWDTRHEGPACNRLDCKTPKPAHSKQQHFVKLHHCRACWGGKLTHPPQIQAPHSVSWAVHRLSPAGTWLLCHVAQKHLHSPLAAGWCKTHQGLGFLLHSLQSYLDLEQMKALSVSKSSKYLMISALRPLAPCIAPIFAFPCPRSRAEITSCTISSPARSKSQGRVWVIFPGEYFSHTSLFVFRQTRTIMQHKFF